MHTHTHRTLAYTADVLDVDLEESERLATRHKELVFKLKQRTCFSKITKGQHSWLEVGTDLKVLKKFVSVREQCRGLTTDVNPHFPSTHPAPTLEKPLSAGALTLKGQEKDCGLCSL